MLCRVLALCASHSLPIPRGSAFARLLAMNGFECRGGKRSKVSPRGALNLPAEQVRDQIENSLIIAVLCTLWGPHTHTPLKQNSPTIQALGIEPCMRFILGPALEKFTIYESITTEANSPTIQALGIEPCMSLILGSALDSPRIHPWVSDGSVHLCSGGHYCRCSISPLCSSSSLGTPWSCTVCRCGFALH